MFRAVLQDGCLRILGSTLKDKMQVLISSLLKNPTLDKLKLILPRTDPRRRKKLT